MGRVYGYVRISSRDQNEARQMAAMREAGVSDRDIYLDKRSGADFERQGYRQLLRRLRAGGYTYRQEYRPAGAEL